MTHTIQNVIEGFENHLIALRDCKNNDYVLAWNNGLGVKFDKDHKASGACGILFADAVVTQEQAERMPEEAWAYIPTVYNGHNEPAHLALRQIVIKREIKQLEDMIADLKEKAGAK